LQVAEAPEAPMFENIDIELDRLELEDLGLTEEEIAGYFLFFCDAYRVKRKTKTPSGGTSECV